MLIGRNNYPRFLILLVIDIFVSYSCGGDDRQEGLYFECDPRNNRYSVTDNGQLKVIDGKLCNENDDPVWLRGMSSHGLQWYEEDINAASLDVLANDWKCDVIRISLYAREDGYEDNPIYWTNSAKQKVDLVIAEDMYVIIDWHMLDPGNPWEDHANAVTYLTDMANTFKDYENIIYEICNEPNQCSWENVQSYAEDMIPRIRAVDSDAVIIIGTPAWSSLGISDGDNEQTIIISLVNADNIMYSFHFYAASHGIEYRSAVRNFVDAKMPLFVTECGTQTYSGDGKNDWEASDAYFNMLDELKISWVNWNFSHDHRAGAVLKSAGNYSQDNLKDAGKYIRARILDKPNY